MNTNIFNFGCYTVYYRCKSSNIIGLIHHHLLSSNSICVEKLRVSKYSLSFIVKKSELLYYNSFLPEVSVSYYDIDTLPTIAVVIRIRKAIRVMMWLYIVAAALMESVLLACYVTGNLRSTLLLVLPAGMIVFVMFMSFWGLRWSASDVLDIIEYAAELP